MSNKIYDVLIVGGSVAGSSVAIHLARKGFNVCMVEKSTFPRDTNSTHFIWPRGMSYLNRLGVAKQILEDCPHQTQMEINIEGISLKGSVPVEEVNKRFKKLHGDEDDIVKFYCAPRRYYLDNLLLQQAQKSGVKVLQNTCVDDLLIDNAKVSGITSVDNNGQRINLKAKTVIGADGRFSRVAKLVDSQTLSQRNKSTFAYYGYFSGIDKKTLSIHKKGRLGTALFPTLNDQHLALVYGPTEWWNEFRQDAEVNFYKAFDYVTPEMSTLIKAENRSENFKAMGRMVAFHRENWGAGWALIGDACSFKDQWSAMGITHALRDAELISQHLGQYLQGEVSFSNSMRNYNEIRAEDYDTYWDMVCDGAEMEPYSKEQLQFFYTIKNSQDKINKFISQVGDTVPLTEEIDAESSIEFPDFIQKYNISNLGYLENLFSQNKIAKAV